MEDNFDIDRELDDKLNSYNQDFKRDDYLEFDDVSAETNFLNDENNFSENTEISKEISEDDFVKENIEEVEINTAIFEEKTQNSTETTEDSAQNVQNSTNNIQNNSLSHLDMTKLDKKSREILEDTDETDYTFKLQDFEGPLDLLVHLIKITKIDIRDIFISNITEQYMEIMKDIDSIDVEKASEFISMAATLLEIKSKHLLPKPEEFDDGMDTTEEDFFRMIEEYKLIKDEMEKLAEIENVNSFYKAPDSSVGEFRYELPESLSVDAMIKAFTSLMQKVSIRAEAVSEKKIEKDRFTVSQKIAQIKDTLILQDKFMFSELFEADYSKSEIINTFLALLELLKRQYIYVEQNDLFEDILIIRNDDIEARLTEEDIGSEYDKDNDSGEEE